MKKTLILMALLGGVLPMTRAEIVTMKGVDVNDSSTYYAFSKYMNYTDGEGDWAMCWAAGAAATVAWWQDRVEENGACIIGANVPRGEDVWRQIRRDWKDRGGQPPRAMQFWLSADHQYSSPDSWLTDEYGKKFAETTGYFPHLLGTHRTFTATDLYFPSEACVTDYIDFNGHDGSISYGDKWEPGRTTYEGASKILVQRLKDGYGGALNTGTHVMAIYQVETDDNGNIIKIWYHDNNSSSNSLRVATVGPNDPLSKTGGNSTYASVGYGDIISSVSLMRTSGLQFDTYDLTMTGEGTDEMLFSHFLNVTVDGHQNYELKYDLRDARSDGSPVTAKDADGNLISTGNLTIKDGKLSLVACEEERVALDGGGKTSGTISFESKDGATRTLSVQHTDTIAAEIKVNAASGNTLDVTKGNTATFGTLSGMGNLDKTGKGAAEVTDAVTLQGEIRVKEGDFIFGEQVQLTDNTQLTVSAGAHVQGTVDKPVTLSITSGVHVNDGKMTLTTTVKGGTLKGSGTFGMVTIDGGEMIVGNSPGHQEFTDTLTLNSGKLVFCAAGLNAPNDGNSVGWESGTYSTINMNGNEFVVNENGEIVIAMSADAAKALTTATGTLELTLVTGLKSGAFSDDQLAALAQKTSFELSLEDGAGTQPLNGLTTSNFAYKVVENALVLTSGISGSSLTVPEPATGTLSLLALVALASRRKRK